MSKERRGSKMDKDITSLVNFGNNDGELLPITKCICGTRFIAWDFIISIYPDTPYECPSCKRKLYFSLSIKLFEKERGGK